MKIDLSNKRSFSQLHATNHFESLCARVNINFQNLRLHFHMVIHNQNVCWHAIISQRDTVEWCLSDQGVHLSVSLEFEPRSTQFSLSNRVVSLAVTQ